MYFIHDVHQIENANITENSSSVNTGGGKHCASDFKR